MTFSLPICHDDLTDRERRKARRRPEQETLLLAGAGADRALGAERSATVALCTAARTMAKADLWRARFAVKRLRKDQRAAIAEAAKD